MSKEIYAINYGKLSSDKLLEIWATESVEGDDLKKIENILKQRDVIREIAPKPQENKNARKRMQ